MRDRRNNAHVPRRPACGLTGASTYQRDRVCILPRFFRYRVAEALIQSTNDKSRALCSALTSLIRLEYWLREGTTDDLCGMGPEMQKPPRRGLRKFRKYRWLRGRATNDTCDWSSARSPNSLLSVTNCHRLGNLASEVFLPRILQQRPVSPPNGAIAAAMAS